MKLFDKIFKRKIYNENSEKQINNISEKKNYLEIVDDGTENVLEKDGIKIKIKEDGSVKVSFDKSLTVQGKEIPLNISFKSIEEFSNYLANINKIKDDPNSCHREPRENEIKVSCEEFDPLKSFVDRELGWKIFKLKNKAIFNGYNNFILSKSEYLQAKQSAEDYKRKTELLNTTASLNLQGIEFEKQGNIKEAIKLYEKNVTLGYPATHSYKRLAILYRKNDDKENELRICNHAIEKFSKNEEVKSFFQKRIDKINNVKKQLILPTERSYYDVKVPLYRQFLAYRTLIPEFDFYTKNDYSSISIILKDNKHITKIQNFIAEFTRLYQQAKNYEEEGNLKKACVFYERLLSEEYFMTTPYDRLIKIYSKSKLKSAEKEVLEYAIKFFTDKRKNDATYISELGKKYGKSEFVKERIQNNEKITYYFGIFEFYNPYKIIDKWQERLTKLNTQ